MRPALSTSIVGFGAAGDVTQSATLSSDTDYVFACFVTNVDPTSVKWNGTDMTQLLISGFVETSGSVNKAYIYGLASPTTGTHDLTIDMPASQDIKGYFLGFSGVDTADAVEGTDNDTGVNVTQTVTNANNTYSIGLQYMATEDGGNTNFEPQSPSVEDADADTGTTNAKDLHVALAHSFFASDGAGAKDMAVVANSLPANGAQYLMVLLNGDPRQSRGGGIPMLLGKKKSI